MASGLDLHCLPTSHKRALGLYMGQMKAAQVRLSLHLSNCHLVGNHMDWSISLIGMYIIRLHDNQSEMFVFWHTLLIR